MVFLYILIRLGWFAAEPWIKSQGLGENLNNVAVWSFTAVWAAACVILLTADPSEFSITEAVRSQHTSFGIRHVTFKDTFIAKYPA